MPWELHKIAKQLQPAVLKEDNVKEWSRVFEVLQSFHCVMRLSLLYAECSVCGSYVWECIFIWCVVVVYELAETFLPDSR